MTRVLLFFAFISSASAIYLGMGKPKIGKWISRLIPVLIVGNGLAFLIVAIFRTGNMPILDAWDDVYLYKQPPTIDVMRLSSGGHVVITSRVFTYLIGNITNFNFQALLALQWLCLVLFALGIARHFRNVPKLFAWIAIGLVFSPVNVNFTLDPRLLQHILAPTLFYMALGFFAEKNPGFRHWVTPLLCAIATLNTAWGLITWPAFSWAVLRDARKKPVLLIPWTGFFSLSVYLYFHWFESGYGQNSFLTPHALFLGLFDFFVLFGTYLYPSNYANPFQWVALMGAIVLSFQLGLIWRKIKAKVFSEWIASTAGIAVTYSVLAAGLATISRAQFYPFASRDMRYNLVAVGLMAAITLQVAQLKNLVVNRVFKAVMVASFLIGLAYFVRSSEKFYALGKRTEACLLAPDPYADLSCYNDVFSDLQIPSRVETFKKTVYFMQKNYLGLFYSK